MADILSDQQPSSEPPSQMPPPSAQPQPVSNSLQASQHPQAPKSQSNDEAAQQNKGLPYDLDVEVSALGAIIFSSTQDQRDEFFSQLQDFDFFRHAHQVIFTVLKDLHTKVSQIDLSTLTEELKSRGLLNNVGGVSYIASLTSSIPSSVNLPYYTQLIRSYSIRRQILGLAQDLNRQSYRYDMQTDAILEQAEQRVLALAEQGHDMHQFLDSPSLVKQTFQIIQERREHKGEFTGIESGFRELDQMTLGFQNSEMVIIGARPSVGKTALALSMVLHIAALKQVPLGFFSLEMNGISLMERLLAAETQINSHHLRSGMLGPQEMTQLSNNLDRLYRAPLFIDDTPNIRLMDLRTRARRLVLRHGVKIILIDYLGLISVGDSSQPRHEQMEEISKNVKALARELNVPVIALSQVGRQSEGKQPGLADLRGSGALEQDADVVLYLHRERASSKELDPHDVENFRTELIVAKQRNGPVGTVELRFIPEYARFVSWNQNPD